MVLRWCRVMWVLVLLGQIVAHYYYSLDDIESLKNYSYIQRDYFERTGRWQGSSYNPTRWKVRQPLPTGIMHNEVKANHRGRKLQATRVTLPCKDGKTYCASNQICKSCLCTIFPTSRYLGGSVFLANNDCIWSGCQCGISR